ncbi:MAG: hypothetical protein LUG18_10350 [Candidatus Azobacteroides sp.]|nr:hypothetical protein [Candidatus Azobacteroides sp.]
MYNTHTTDTHTLSNTHTRTVHSSQLLTTMTGRYISLLFCVLFISLQTEATNKIRTIDHLREQLSFRKTDQIVITLSAEESWALTDYRGRFTDMKGKEETVEEREYRQRADGQACMFINQITLPAFSRLWSMAEEYRGEKNLDPSDKKLRMLLQGIIFYGELENERNNQAPGRFHASCFAIPRHAVNIYFSLFDLMQAVEDGRMTDPVAVMAHRKLLDVGFQSWKQPYRNDPTDENVISVERFRKHVWWVGGNALDYRPVFETALMMRSVPMVDVMAEVAKNAISVVSQTTYNEAFWTEGITADGAGWGHGKQCLVWGYPIDGLKGAFKILNCLKDSPWAQQLSREDVAVLMKYIRNSSFYHYKGVIPPLVDRKNMIWQKNYIGQVPSFSIAEILLESWQNSLTTEEIKELEDFVRESSQWNVKMTDYPDGWYHGVRYFYNNDDIIKKTQDYYIFVNMASSRVDGLESAWPVAAGYNFYSADGVTLFQRDGEGYRKILGAMDLTAWPGVTTRQTPVPLFSVENWRGFTSRHNFAAGAGDGKGSFAAGFIYEKINGSYRDEPEFAAVNDRNKDIYGVYAQKSYFMFDDIFVATGSGITNLQPEKEGTITTTIEQTYSELPPPCFSSPYMPLQVVEKYNAGKGEIRWVQHAGFTYGVVPEFTNGNLRLGRESRITNWQRLTNANSATNEYRVDLFRMDIDHGRCPDVAKYAYMIDCTGKIPVDIPEILQIDNQLHAVQDASGTRFGAIFFDPEQEIRTALGTFLVSHPVSLFAEKRDGQLFLTVTDAKMDSNVEVITILTSVPLSGKNVVRKEKDLYEVIIYVPAEPDRGAPVTEVFVMEE